MICLESEQLQWQWSSWLEAGQDVSAASERQTDK